MRQRVKSQVRAARAYLRSPFRGRARRQWPTRETVRAAGHRAPPAGALGDPYRSRTQRASFVTGACSAVSREADHESEEDDDEQDLVF